eukprot:SAG31_NODE_1785_length_7278_cov_4.205321_5_plen_155_part_00
MFFIMLRALLRRSSPPLLRADEFVRRVRGDCPRLSARSFARLSDARDGESALEPSCSPREAEMLTHGDTFSISALHLSIKVPYFSNSGHKNEKVTSYLAARSVRRPGETARENDDWRAGEAGRPKLEREVPRPALPPLQSRLRLLETRASTRAE